MVEAFLKTYLQNRPLFLGLSRAKELQLFRRFLPAGVAAAGYRILDFGSGDGFFSATLLGSLPVCLTAADGDEKAAEKAAAAGIYRQVTCADGARLPFASGSFDLIISNSVLEHVADVQRTASELFRVLKERGTLLCSVMTDRWEEYLLGRTLLGKSYAAWLRRRQNHQHLLRCEEWHTRFERAGFHPRTVIGYLDKKASRWLELLHYPSAPALLSHRLFGRWVFFPFLFDLFPLHRLLAPLVSNDIPPEDAAALFFALDKDA